VGYSRSWDIIGAGYYMLVDEASIFSLFLYLNKCATLSYISSANISSLNTCVGVSWGNYEGSSRWVGRL